jgi:hypothetical protein
MGLFDKRDKKRKDDFDSPVEQIDLGAMSKAAKAPDPAPAAPPPAQTPAPAPAPAALKQEPAQAPAPAQAAAPAATVKFAPAAKAKETAVHPETDDYGIEKAIELMRTLPSDNVELVVQVVKFSLESVGIKLPAIIEDAIRRQKDIQGRIGVLKAEIADLEQEIKVRKDEIEKLDADHKETSMVRDRLELAENIGKPRAAAAEPLSPAAPMGGLARVTRQTGSPPMQSSPSSSPSLPGVGSSGTPPAKK